MKQNLKNEDARKAILAGMAEVADIVGATLGPRGQTVILDRPFGAPLVTKDGVTVAKQIAVPDVFENAGAKLIQEVAQKTNMEAGDGTTAATILTHALFSRRRQSRRGRGQLHGHRARHLSGRCHRRGASRRFSSTHRSEPNRVHSPYRHHRRQWR